MSKRFSIMGIISRADAQKLTALTAQMQTTKQTLIGQLVRKALDENDKLLVWAIKNYEKLPSPIKFQPKGDMVVVGTVDTQEVFELITLLAKAQGKTRSAYVGELIEKAIRN